MRDLYIDVSHEVLEDLKVRLRGARFPVVLDEQEKITQESRSSL